MDNNITYLDHTVFIHHMLLCNLLIAVPKLTRANIVDKRKTKNVDTWHNYHYCIYQYGGASVLEEIMYALREMQLLNWYNIDVTNSARLEDKYVCTVY